MECSNHYHKDFCNCGRALLKEWKQSSRERKCVINENFLLKNKIEFEFSNSENVVVSNHWGDLIYISLVSFKFKYKGSNKWIQKKPIYNKLTTKLKFGKYKGLKFSDVLTNDLQYIKWFISISDSLFCPEIYLKLK